MVQCRPTETHLPQAEQLGSAQQRDKPQLTHPLRTSLQAWLCPRGFGVRVVALARWRSRRGDEAAVPTASDAAGDAGGGKGQLLSAVHSNK